MTKQRNPPGTTLRAITCDGQLVGWIGSSAFPGQTEVTCWIGRAAWARGIASRALALLAGLVPARPLYARVASDNIGSLRAAQKAGFKITGTRNVVRTRAEQPNPADNPPQGLAPQIRVPARLPREPLARAGPR